VLRDIYLYWQGVVAEATLLLDRLEEVVKEFHRHGLFLFTYGEVNNKLENYNAQKSYGLDGIILDDVARVAKVPPSPGAQLVCPGEGWVKTYSNLSQKAS
jgi:glycerophosphoryl diester phosphodiesterase